MGRLYACVNGEWTVVQSPITICWNWVRYMSVLPCFRVDIRLQSYNIISHALTCLLFPKQFTAMYKCFYITKWRPKLLAKWNDSLASTRLINPIMDHQTRPSRAASVRILETLGLHHFIDNIFKHVFGNENVSILIQILLHFISKETFYFMSVMIRVTSQRRTGEHYWPRCMTPYGVTGLYWVNYIAKHTRISVIICITQEDHGSGCSKYHTKGYFIDLWFGMTVLVWPW